MPGEGSDSTALHSFLFHWASGVACLEHNMVNWQCI